MYSVRRFLNSILLILLQRNRDVAESGNALGIDAESKCTFQLLRAIRNGESSGQRFACADVNRSELFKATQRQRTSSHYRLRGRAIVGNGQHNVLPVLGVEGAFQRIATGGLDLGVILKDARQGFASSLSRIDLCERTMDSSKYRLCCIRRDAAIVLFSAYDHIIRRVCSEIDPVFLPIPANFDAEQFGDLADREIIGCAPGNIHIRNDRWNLLPIGCLEGFSGENLILAEQRNSSFVVLHAAGGCGHTAHRRNYHEHCDHACNK